MSNTFEASQLIQTLVGGSQPEVGDTIQFTEKGWRFRRNLFRGSFAGTPANVEDGDLWYDTSVSKLKIRVDGTTWESSAFVVSP